VPLCEVCQEDVPVPLPGHGPALAACYWNADERAWAMPGSVYVEGWAVRSRDGQLEPFEHGWVERDGEVDDVTPHHHAIKYFRATGFPNHRAMFHQRGVEIPVYRTLTVRTLNDAPNPKYDDVFAQAYAAAKEMAEAYCQAKNKEGSQKAGFPGSLAEFPPSINLRADVAPED